jgi:hypothetical protein
LCHTPYLLEICFAPSLADSVLFLTLTRLVVVFIFVNFSFALFTPPLGDYHRPPTLRPSVRPCLTSLGMGGGLLAAASALRSSLPLFGPPEQKSSSSSLLERVTARRSLVFYCSTGSPPVEWGCSYLRRWNRSSVCNGTVNASVFVHCGCRGLNMYVILGTKPCFSSFSSTKTRLLVV